MVCTTPWKDQVGWVTQTRGDQQRQQKPAGAGRQNMGSGTARHGVSGTGDETLDVDDGKVGKGRKMENTAYGIPWVREFGESATRPPTEPGPEPTTASTGEARGKFVNGSCPQKQACLLLPPPELHGGRRYRRRGREGGGGVGSCQQGKPIYSTQCGWARLPALSLRGWRGDG